MQCVRFVRGGGRPGKRSRELPQLRRVVRVERGRRVVVAVRRGAADLDVHRDLEALRDVAGGRRASRSACSGRCTTSRGRTPSRRRCTRAGCSPDRCRTGRRAAVGRVIVAGHDDDRLEPAREVPELRQRLPVALIMNPIRLASSRCCSSACGIATLSRSTQSGCTPAAEEQSSERIGRHAVAFLARPCRVALARVDDRSRQIVGERRRLAAAAAHAAQRDGRIAAWPWRRSSRASPPRSRRSACSDPPCRGTASSGRRCRRPARPRC